MAILPDPHYVAHARAWVAGLTGFLEGEISRRMGLAAADYTLEFRLIGVTERTGHIETSLADLALPDGGRVILFADDSPALRWLRLPD